MPICKHVFSRPFLFSVSACLLAFPVCFSSHHAFAAGAVAEQGVVAQKALEQPLFSMIKSGRVGEARLKDKSDLAKFYGERQGAYLWVRGGQFTSMARDVFKLVQDSWEHGLNPDIYHRMELASMMRSRFDNDEMAARAELLMSDAVVRYGRDITGMRLSPKTMNADLSSWSRGIGGYTLLTILQRTSSPEDVLEKMAPHDPVYKGLQKELKRILAAHAEGVKAGKSRISFSGLLRPGDRHAVVTQLRERFQMSSNVENADLYDEKVVEKVEAFQKTHGLKADGIIGPRTVAVMNEGLREQLVKVLANLERRRWVKRPMPSRYVEVNIPAMWARGVENNKTVFQMNVIIGRKKRETTSFVDEITGVRFNPSWYVPDTVKNEDYLPELQQDPQALAEKGIAFRVRKEDGSGYQEVASEAIDWAKMTEAKLKSVQMVQGPGASNALGRIRVLMPNRYDIYLHDTNSPGLFRKDNRALSSGCVRLSDPHRMASFILKNNPGWSDDRMETYLADDKMREIHLKQALPVYLFYFTIWENESGSLVFGNDIYGLDEELVDVLKSNGQVNFPMI